MSNHTPGPWEYSWGCFGLKVTACAGNTIQTIASVQTFIPEFSPEAESNARLISAAPDLLAALEEIVGYSGGANTALEDEYVMERVYAAIAKARGE